jgi:hypothetical protein
MLLMRARTSWRLTWPGARHTRPRATISHQHSGPPRHFTVMVKDSRGFRLARGLDGARCARAVAVAFGGRDILTSFHCHVVDGNDCSISSLRGIHQDVAATQRALVDATQRTDAPMLRIGLSSV